MSVELSDEELAQLYTKIGENVKSLRKKHNISQMELAHSIGNRSSASISKPEKNIDGSHFSIKQLLKISKYFKIDINELFK